jgi:cytochrome b561
MMRNDQQRWGMVSVWLHWLSALAVIGLFALGLWMVELTYYDDWYKEAPDIHRSIGVLLFIATVLRLLWRWSNPKPAPLASHSRLEKIAAGAAHVVLYLMLFAIMISGYLISTADGLAVDVFNLFSVPATLQGIEHQEDIAGVFHYWLAVSLIALVVLHALAAIKHHFIDRDATLKRMLGR